MSISIHPLMAAVSMVTMLRTRTTEGASLAPPILLSSASGFFYSKMERLYFVTNKHVVAEPVNGQFPDTLKVRLHTSPTNLALNVERDLTLTGVGGKGGWIQHPNPKVDIAAIPIPVSWTQGLFVQTLSRQNFLPPDIDLGIGGDAIVIGYPRRFHDEVYNLPVMRMAMIASYYGVPFQGDPAFLIDAHLHLGTSGSPVITRPSGSWTMKGGGFAIGSTEWYFLGIHSAIYQFGTSEAPEPSGLNVVWYAHLIEELLP